MENETGRIEMKERVLKRIRQGEVAMHSQGYFAVKVVALVVVSLLALVVSVLLFTFIFFTIRVNFHGPIPMGPGAPFFFLHFFPWHLLLLDILLIVVAEWLLRSFRFAYRSPVLYLLLGLVAFALSLGLFVDRATHFNEMMLDHAHHRILPPLLNDMYEHAHHPEMDAF